MVALHARREEDKEERRQLILDAALRLFAEDAYHRVTMARIADEVGLAKGTLYLYYPTKESVFLQGLSYLRNRFYRDLSANLEGLESLPLEERIESYCREVSEAFWRAESFRRQLTLITSLMEEQLDPQELRENKEDAMRQFADVIRTLYRIFPELPEAHAWQIVQQFRALVVGYSCITTKKRTPVCKQPREGQQNPQEFFITNLQISLSATLRYFLPGQEEALQPLNREKEQGS